MKNDATTKLGSVMFSFDGYMGKASVNGRLLYEVSADEIDDYNEYVETATDYLIALIEMYIKDGGQLHEIQTESVSR